MDNSKNTLGTEGPSEQSATSQQPSETTTLHDVLPDFRIHDQVQNKQMDRKQERELVKKMEMQYKSQNSYVYERFTRRAFQVVIKFALFRFLPLLIFLFLGAVAIGYVLNPTDTPNAVDVIVVVNSEDQAVLMKAIELQKDNFAPIILILGERRAKEAGSFSSLAQSQGIPANKILTEQSGQTRYEQALSAEKILDEKRFSSMLLVAPPYEQRKLLMTFGGAFRVLSSDVSILNAPASVPYWDRLWWWANENGREKTLNELSEIIEYWQKGYF